MGAAVMRTKKSALAFGLALGAMLALAAPLGAMHLDLEQSCTALVATEGGEPGPSATVRVGDELEVHGLFPRGEGAPNVRVRIDKDGELQDLLTVEQDVDDEILVILVFEPGDEGQWQITAFGENSGCGGPADVTVLASAAQPSPIPTPAPAAMPDTASSADLGAPLPLLVLGALAALVLGVAGSTALQRRAAPPSKPAGD